MFRYSLLALFLVGCTQAPLIVYPESPLAPQDVLTETHRRVPYTFYTTPGNQVASVAPVTEKQPPTPGNCVVHAATAKYEVERRGLGKGIVIVCSRLKTQPVAHAVTLVNGIWVLDVRHKQPITLAQYLTECER